METIQSKEQWVLRRLEGFYANPENFSRIEQILTGKSRLSLRLLDWFVTNYSKKYNVSFMAKSNHHVIVYLVYKSHLKAYNKKMFDPFWTPIMMRCMRIWRSAHRLFSPKMANVVSATS